MEKLLDKKRKALYFAAASLCLLLASLTVLIISTVNFLYIPLIISLLVFIASAYLTPLFLISRIDLSNMIKISELLSYSEDTPTNSEVREHIGLKNQKYTDKLIEKCKKGGYLS